MIDPEKAKDTVVKYLAQHPGDDEIRCNMDLPILDGSVILHKYYIDKIKINGGNHYIEVDGGMLQIKFVKNIGE